MATMKIGEPMSQRYVFTPPSIVSVPVVGTDEQLPVHRIYCVGRNYAEHAKEMGFSGREDPFFFIKPADTLVVAAEQAPATIDYPTLTQNLHHEVELVVAIGRAGRDIAATDAHHHIFGYAVGLDMTRRDLQNEMKKQGRPWCIGKSHEQSAPIGWITPASNMGAMESAAIELRVNGELRQSSHIHQLIWNVGEIIEHLSRAWTLQAGDLIFTGTPEGVGPVVRGDRLQARVDGLAALDLRIA
jgi:fumarylpyruvate hydrolase